MLIKKQLFGADTEIQLSFYKERQLTHKKERDKTLAILEQLLLQRNTCELRCNNNMRLYYVRLLVIQAKLSEKQKNVQKHRKLFKKT